MRISPVSTPPLRFLPLGNVPAGIDADFRAAYERYNNAQAQALGTTIADESPAAPTATPAGFMDGLKAWTSPLDALDALKNSFQGDVTANLAYVGGLALPPLAVLMLLMGGGRRRFF